ncbi:MAG: glutathione S-transferase family protein [Hyphomicrobium aestuarii]|nr:glutathione S-transferase family protein [Hyphomicrobium aestuarii]
MPTAHPEHAPRYELVIGTKVWSSWSLRPWLLMRECGIPFDETVIELRQQSSAADISRVSPSGKVPVLIDREIGNSAGFATSEALVIWDTLAIVEHLAEHHPDAGIWPRDPAARAIARSVSAEMHAGFTALRQHCPMDFHARSLVPLDASAITADVQRILAIWADCRRRFRAADKSAGPFLFGAFCAADAMFAPVVSRFTSYNLDLATHSNAETAQTASAYMAAVRNLDGWRAWA